MYFKRAVWKITRHLTSLHNLAKKEKKSLNILLHVLQKCMHELLFFLQFFIYFWRNESQVLWENSLLLHKWPDNDRVARSEISLKMSTCFVCPRNEIYNVLTLSKKDTAETVSALEEGGKGSICPPNVFPKMFRI